MAASLAHREELVLCLILASAPLEYGGPMRKTQGRLSISGLARLLGRGLQLGVSAVRGLVTRQPTLRTKQSRFLRI